jgi:hypothetical protein
MITEIFRAMYTMVDLYFKDNGDHFKLFFISQRAINLAKENVYLQPHILEFESMVYVNAENHLLHEIIKWARSNDLKYDRTTVDDLQDGTMYDRLSIGATVLWKGKQCSITNRFRNGIIVISPKGNGDNQAKYYTVNERDVTLADEQITGVKTVKEKSKGLDSITIKMKMNI